MSENRIAGLLKQLGLSAKEGEIYLFLSKKGAQNAHSVSANLKIDRVQTYRALKGLQEKGIVEATLETPIRFAAVPFEILLTSFIKNKRNEVSKLEAKKSELIADWRSLGVREADYPLPRFRILMERNRIYDEISRMIEETKKEILELTTSTGIIQEDILGTVDLLVAYTRKDPSIQSKILTNITKDNYEMIEQLSRTISSEKLNIQIRHTDLSSRLYPRFVVKDEEETVLYVTSRDESSLIGQVDTGLWISSRLFVSTLRESYMDLWRNAVEAHARIEELRTGKPLIETTVIRDVQEARSKLERILGSAKQDVIAITSSDGINVIPSNNPFKKCSERGLKVRIMAPIDLDNFGAAIKLSESSEVRHVPISYLMMLLVDNMHLFIFKTLPTSRVIKGTIFNLDNAFYSNDDRYIERVSEMLNDIWRRGLDLREIAEGSTTSDIQVKSSDTASKIIETMLKNNANTVVVVKDGNPVGVVSERDLLEKLLIPWRNPEEVIAGEVMSLPVVDIQGNEVISQALQTMRKTGVPRLAIMRKGTLVGMLARKG